MVGVSRILPHPMPAVSKEQEVLFLDSHYGARRASSPNHSPLVNLAGMTNGGGGFELAPGRGAERGGCGRTIPILVGCSAWEPQSRDCLVWGYGQGSVQRGELQDRVRLSAGGAGSCQDGDCSIPGTVEQPWVWGAHGGSPAWPWAPRMGQRAASSGGRGVSRRRGAGRGVSSSLRLFEEAISGRAGSSYHALLPPGQREGEPASPPRPHHTLPQGSMPAKPAPCIPGTLWHPKAAPWHGPKWGTLPPQHTHPNVPAQNELHKVAVPLPSIHSRRGQRVGSSKCI